MVQQKYVMFFLSIFSAIFRLHLLVRQYEDGFILGKQQFNFIPTFAAKALSTATFEVISLLNFSKPVLITLSRSSQRNFIGLFFILTTGVRISVTSRRKYPAQECDTWRELFEPTLILRPELGFSCWRRFFFFFMKCFKFKF